jgi:hypothetical protein
LCTKIVVFIGKNFFLKKSIFRLDTFHSRLS